MKRITKTLFIFVALTALLLSLTACGNGIKADRAKADTSSFFDAIKFAIYRDSYSLEAFTSRMTVSFISGRNTIGYNIG